MTSPIEIRKANILDASTIAELVCSVAASCLGEDAISFVNTISPDKIKANIQDKNFSYALGFVASELVAMAAMRDQHHFYHLFVAAKFQNKGIAMSLWLYLKNEAVASGTSIFTVNSSHYAVPVYKKFGFVQMNTAQIKNGIRYVPMQLSLWVDDCGSARRLLSIQT